MTINELIELDAWIAENVMGYKKRILNPEQRKFYKLDYVWDGPNVGSKSDDELCFSSNINAAMEVVNKIHEHPKPVLQLAAPQQDGINEKWRATFSRKWWSDESPYEWEGEGDTAAEAICRAAKAWAKGSKQL